MNVTKHVEASKFSHFDHAQGASKKEPFQTMERGVQENGSVVDQRESGPYELEGENGACEEKGNNGISDPDVPTSCEK